MTNDRLNDLAAILKRMYMDGRERKEAGVMVILFAVRYADELAGVNMTDLRERAGIPDFAPHLKGGLSLARYVRER